MIYMASNNAGLVNMYEIRSNTMDILDNYLEYQLYSTASAPFCQFCPGIFLPCLTLENKILTIQLNANIKTLT